MAELLVIIVTLRKSFEKITEYALHVVRSPYVACHTADVV